ncbi:hypothetical protein T10_5301 [Trichinella papuae]|uniref:Uncharacterized protein n=1 Tax=Trichinella papuae TaxID=268474 RepID=A0A0V1M400_9BILA|nr:hypothetical protein T10_5301 [Trichinella papuae]
MLLRIFIVHSLHVSATVATISKLTSAVWGLGRDEESTSQKSHHCGNCEIFHHTAVYELNV